MSKLSDLIKEKRTLKQFSKRKLAEQAGISSTEMMKIESGERENPPAKTLKKIAEILDIDQMEIMVSAGYLDEEYLAKFYKLRGIGKLNSKQIENLQQFIDFLGYCTVSNKNTD